MQINIFYTPKNITKILPFKIHPNKMQLGSGTFGNVSRLGNVATKSFRPQKSPEDTLAIFILEATMCRYLTSDYTIQCNQLSNLSGNYEIDMEFGLDVTKYVRVSPQHLRSAVDGLLSAINYIHSQGILHLDIKPANMVIVDDRLKLIDFGLATFISDLLIPQNTTFTFFYRPPELFEKSCPAHPSLDLWATGISIIELVKGRNPFNHPMLMSFLNEKDFPNVIRKTVGFLPNNYFAESSDYYLSLVRNLLYIDPFKRNIRGLSLIPLDLPFLNLQIDTFTDNVIGILVGRTLDLTLGWKDLHMAFLTMKILYQVVKANYPLVDVNGFYHACLKIAEILVVGRNLWFTFDKLIEMADNTFDRKSIEIWFSVIQQQTKFNLLENDTYLYVYEKLVRDDYKDNYKSEINNFFILMLYSPKLFEIEAKLIFTTFDKIYRKKSLNDKEQDIYGILRTTLEKFDKDYVQYTSKNLFSIEFRNLLTNAFLQNK